jgi:hypothetical protein
VPWRLEQAKVPSRARKINGNPSAMVAGTEADAAAPDYLITS